MTPGNTGDLNIEDVEDVKRIELIRFLIRDNAFDDEFLVTAVSEYFVRNGLKLKEVSYEEKQESK